MTFRNFPGFVSRRLPRSADGSFAAVVKHESKATFMAMHTSPERGEGAPYTGLKPAGLDVGPVIPLAERAIATGPPRPVADYFIGVLHDQLKHRLEEVNTLAATRDRSVADVRAWVDAMPGFQVYSHHVLQALLAPTAMPGTPTEKATSSRINGSSH